MFIHTITPTQSHLKLSLKFYLSLLPSAWASGSNAYTDGMSAQFAVSIALIELVKHACVCREAVTDLLEFAGRGFKRQPELLWIG